MPQKRSLKRICFFPYSCGSSLRDSAVVLQSEAFSDGVLRSAGRVFFFPGIEVITCQGNGEAGVLSRVVAKFRVSRGGAAMNRRGYPPKTNVVFPCAHEKKAMQVVKKSALLCFQRVKCIYSPHQARPLQAPPPLSFPNPSAISTAISLYCVGVVR